MQAHDIHFLNYAIAIAQQSMNSNHGGPFGCVIVKDGKIIAEGTNCVTTTNDPTAHAEVVAIRKACQVLGSFQLTGCTIYTSCEPCPMCLGAIYWARPNRVVFASTRHDAAAIGFDDHFIYDEMAKPMAKRKILFKHLPQPEADALFNDWAAKGDKTRY